MTRRLLIAAAIAGVIGVYGLRLDDAAGLYKDDAYYIVLATSVASGQGYALISSAAAPVLPAFPPGFALLLAPIVAAAPGFPGNVVFLKAVSIAAMLGTGWLLFRYLHAYRAIGRGRAIVIALLAALTPGFVFLATSTVMSECAFTLALMASAVAIERAALAQQSGRRAVVLAAALTTAAWLIRGSGIAVVAAGAVFLLWKRGWRASIGFVAVCGICYVPWSLYSATHQATEAESAAHGGDVVRYYHSPLVSKGAEPPIKEGDLRRRITTNLVNIFGRDVGAAIFPAGYRGAEESGLEVFLLAGATGLRAGSMGIGPAFMVLSAVLGVFVLIGALTMARRGLGVAEFICVVTIGMLALIASHSFRYVLPITPFLLGYFLIGVESAASRWRPEAGLAAFRVVAGCLLFFLAVEHGRYIWLKSFGPSPLWIEDAREVRAVTDFVERQLPKDAALASTNPALMYLTTGHRAVAYVDPYERWERWRASGIRYLVALHEVPLPNSSLGYRVLFQSPRVGFWVLDLQSREP